MAATGGSPCWHRAGHQRKWAVPRAPCSTPQNSDSIAPHHCLTCSKTPMLVYRLVDQQVVQTLAKVRCDILASLLQQWRSSYLSSLSNLKRKLGFQYPRKKKVQRRGPRLLASAGARSPGSQTWLPQMAARATSGVPTSTNSCDADPCPTASCSARVASAARRSCMLTQ